MGRALITGASAGIGAEFARQLAAEGRDLVLVARNLDRLEELATELRAAHQVDVEVISADVGDRDDVDRLAVRLRQDERPIDVLINNAGFGVGAGFTRSALEDEQAMIDVMISAVMRLSHAALPGMIERGHGAVVVVSSVAGWLPRGTYSAAKAWATVFTEALAGQLEGTGVRAMAVCPGFTHTEFHERAHIDVSTSPEWMWLSAQDVVGQALVDLQAGRVISVAGAQYKGLSAIAQSLPRPLLRRAVKYLG